MDRQTDILTFHTIRETDAGSLCVCLSDSLKKPGIGARRIATVSVPDSR